jgi:hypothetical protein
LHFAYSAALLPDLSVIREYFIILLQAPKFLGNKIPIFVLLRYHLSIPTEIEIYPSVSSWYYCGWETANDISSLPAIWIYQYRVLERDLKEE